MDRAALIVIDVQKGFAAPVWGRRNNPACESNIVALIDHWRDRGLPVVYVRHDSASPSSPLHPDQPGNALIDALPADPDLLVVKHVNSAFYGRPDLDRWLRDRGLKAVVICGITTNHCCETTARMAGNLGYATTFVIDATHTFDRTGPDGAVIDADQLARVTAANLHEEFATIATTAGILAG